MNEFNPNCGKCGMLNSRGFCSLTACRYPSNAIVVEPKVIRGMMVNPQIEKPQTNADRIRQMSDEELANYLIRDVEAEAVRRSGRYLTAGEIDRAVNDCVSWLKSPAEGGEG